MRISTKGRHAVMAMVDLLRHGNGKPVSLAEIAERQEISLSYLEQLVAKLKGQGLVKSLRGPGGGYMLGDKGGHTTVARIIDAVDDPEARHPSIDIKTASGRQLTDILWQAIGDEITHYLETITLDDVSNCTMCSNFDFTEPLKRVANG